MYIFKAKEQCHPEKDQAKRAPHFLELVDESPRSGGRKFDKAFWSHVLYVFCDGQFMQKNILLRFFCVRH